MKKNKIQTILIIIALVTAIFAKPAMLMAYDDYMTPDMFAMLRANNSVMVVFDPTPGAFTYAETNSGIRVVDAGQSLPRANFPYAPIRDGYTFDGWRFEDGTRADGYYLQVGNQSDIITLAAIWVAYGEATTSTPAPAHSPSPTPTPVPAHSPSPTPTSSPTPPPTAGMPNPSTNPITISLMIFGAVATLGIAAFGIISLSMRHTAAVEKYRTNAMRYKRESRLTSLLGIGNSKLPK